MNRKTVIIAAVVVIALIASSAFLYIYYQGQAAEEEKIKTLANLVDDKGYVTSLSAYPDRIVSLAPSTTEILFALDLDDKVVAVTDYDNYPYDFSRYFYAVLTINNRVLFQMVLPIDWNLVSRSEYGFYSHLQLESATPEWTHHHGPESPTMESRAAKTAPWAFIV